uniref:Uncharacterized protein n=1 Tax=Lepeophtheirus salmonis TaxID=72036 RepID=A0A0K2V5N2_LEPSM
MTILYLAPFKRTDKTLQFYVVVFLCDQKCTSNKQYDGRCVIFSTHKSISETKIIT